MLTLIIYLCYHPTDIGLIGWAATLDTAIILAVLHIILKLVSNKGEDE